MKPHEETWTADRKEHGWHIGPQPDGRCSMFANTDATTHARQEQTAKLIAAAPEMARMLLAREWDSEDCCPSCGAVRVLSGPFPRAEHAADCAWTALMKKAGLR